MLDDGPSQDLAYESNKDDEVDLTPDQKEFLFVTKNT